MFNIIRTEWLKVRTYRTFWVLFGVAVLFIPAINIIVAEFNRNIKGETKGLFSIALYDFDTVWRMMGNVTSLFTIFFGFLVIILVTNEFTFKTHRQNVIDGWSRVDFLLSKVFWVLFLSVFALIITVITGLCLGLVYGKSDIGFDDFSAVWFYFGQMVLMLTMALFVGMFVKRAGLAMVLYLAYTMGVEQLIVAVGKKYVGSVFTLLPIQAGDEMMPLPIVDKMVPNVSLYSPTVYALTIVAYIGLFGYLVYRKMAKADL
ncbi:ABC transporter permease [uncultured Chitinophaga sp.]|uniref:ABC transporter permease n=1 Tax=uncultured Chitinophaga sp. TaxID=339340 RepID=UPI0025DC00E0|nr:ABC transporter permease [uncultured Chitinophaga sp.]